MRRKLNFFEKLTYALQTLQWESHRCLKVADINRYAAPRHQRFIKSIGLYRAGESCLHKTDVIEHVILVNGVVERNRNSVVCGSVAVIPTRERGSSLSSDNAERSAGCTGQRVLCESRVIRWLLPPLSRSSSTTPAANLLSYSPFSLFLSPSSNFSFLFFLVFYYPPLSSSTPWCPGQLVGTKIFSSFSYLPFSYFAS